jgi:hypothetical protein
LETWAYSPSHLESDINAVKQPINAARYGLRLLNNISVIVAHRTQKYLTVQDRKMTFADRGIVMYLSGIRRKSPFLE